jgi:PAS domain-containing protein
MAYPIQIILLRQLAGYLSVPVFLVDPQGNLLFYNEAAEEVLGRRFDEVGHMPPEEWSSVFKPLDENGQPLLPEQVPLRRTLISHRPAQQRMFIHAHDGVARHIEIVSIPIMGLQGEFLGAASLYWQVQR